MVTGDATPLIDMTPLYVPTASPLTLVETVRLLAVPLRLLLPDALEVPDEITSQLPPVLVETVAVQGDTKLPEAFKLRASV